MPQVQHSPPRLEARELHDHRQRQLGHQVDRLRAGQELQKYS